MKINKWNIIYLPRKIIEPTSIGSEIEMRPIVVLKVYKNNVIFSLITKTDQSNKLLNIEPEPTHIEITPISKSISKSFVKISIIQTLSIGKINTYGSSRNISIENIDRIKLSDELKKFYFGNK